MQLHLIRLVAIAVFVALGGCMASRAAQTVKDADERMVANGQYLGEVHGTSGWGNIAASQGIENAQNEAREQAAKMGATHIVWTNTVGGYSPFVSGRAYKLPP
jgi:hypothetical protein